MNKIISVFILFIGMSAFAQNIPSVMKTEFPAAALQDSVVDLDGNSATIEKVFSNYKGKIVHSDFRCDFLIADCIILEIKSVKDIDDIHKAQVLNYMNLLKVPKGILVNFNVTNIFHEGQKTFVNKYFQQLS